jgi:dTDP-4-dehydrorhamnose reductase
MKRLLVTGASGFLGWNICSQGIKEWDVFGVAFSKSLEIPEVSILKTDLTDHKDLRQLFDEDFSYGKIFCIFTDKYII